MIWHKAHNQQHKELDQFSEQVSRSNFMILNNLVNVPSLEGEKKKKILLFFFLFIYFLKNLLFLIATVATLSSSPSSSSPTSRM